VTTTATAISLTRAAPAAGGSSQLLNPKRMMIMMRGRIIVRTHACTLHSTHTHTCTGAGARTHIHTHTRTRTHILLHNLLELLYTFARKSVTTYSDIVDTSISKNSKA